MSRIGILVLGGFLLILLANTFYVVQEYHQVIVTQFGRPVGDPIATPGLKVRMPFIHKIHRFERRFLEWEGDSNQIPTRDKRFIYIECYARWRISDPLLFYQRLRDERGAQLRLDDILDGETRNAIAKHDLVEVIRTSNRQPAIDELATAEDAVILQTISLGRERIRAEVLEHAQARTTDLGIEVLDVQFKRIRYVDEVLRKVYERMISERKRIADRFRSEGEGEAQRISGEKERDLKRIQSEAYKTAQEIVGRADAEATDIYAAAYNRSAESRSFYEFLKTMEAYQNTLDKESTLILSTDGDFYRLLKHSKP